jgi:hypothetical protein
VYIKLCEKESNTNQITGSGTLTEGTDCMNNRVLHPLHLHYRRICLGRISNWRLSYSHRIKKSSTIKPNQKVMSTPKNKTSTDPLTLSHASVSSVSPISTSTSGSDSMTSKGKPCKVTSGCHKNMKSFCIRGDTHRHTALRIYTCISKRMSLKSHFLFIYCNMFQPHRAIITFLHNLYD